VETGLGGTVDGCLCASFRSQKPTGQQFAEDGTDNGVGEHVALEVRLHGTGMKRVRCHTGTCNTPAPSCN
jgi:hypothetical protein